MHTHQVKWGTHKRSQSKTLTSPIHENKESKLILLPLIKIYKQKHNFVFTIINNHPTDWWFMENQKEMLGWGPPFMGLINTILLLAKNDPKLRPTLWFVGLVCFDDGCFHESCTFFQTLRNLFINKSGFHQVGLLEL